MFACCSCYVLGPGALAVLSNNCVVQVWVCMPHYTKSREVKGGSGVQIELLCSLCNAEDE